MLLERLLDECEYELLQGTLDREITQIDYDSRKVIPGSLFVCISGANVDGHGFIDQVIEKGATTIVCTKDVRIQEEMTYIKVEDARIALALLSCAFFNHPSRKMTVIGITGTKGKTTTSYMVESILEKANKKVGIIGTIGSIVNGEYHKTKNTTPESFELQRLMNEMVESGCEYCVMEVSSQGLMLHRVEGIDFDYGIFTNLAPDHISEYEHHSFEDYMNCKKMLFQKCKIGIFNKDDDHYQDMIDGATCQIYTYSFNKQSDLYASHIVFIRNHDELGISFLAHGFINSSFHINIPGEFNVYNALVAIMLCYFFQIDIHAIKMALENIHIRGRLEIVPIHQDYIVMIDYAHNPLSVESLLKTILQYFHHHIICVYGVGGLRDKQRRYDIGRIVAKYHAKSILTADNPRGENVLKICEDIVLGIQKMHGEYIIIEDREKAIYYALDIAFKDDIILCLGKGHEDYQIMDTQPLYFNERQIIENYFHK